MPQDRYLHRRSLPMDDEFEDLCIHLLRTLMKENPHKTGDNRELQIRVGDTLDGDE